MPSSWTRFVLDGQPIDDECIKELSNGSVAKHVIVLPEFSDSDNNTPAQTVQNGTVVQVNTNADEDTTEDANADANADEDTTEDANTPAKTVQIGTVVQVNTSADEDTTQDANADANADEDTTEDAVTPASSHIIELSPGVTLAKCEVITEEDKKKIKCTFLNGNVLVFPVSSNFLFRTLPSNYYNTAPTRVKKMVCASADVLSNSNENAISFAMSLYAENVGPLRTDENGNKVGSLQRFIKENVKLNLLEFLALAYQNGITNLRMAAGVNSPIWLFKLYDKTKWSSMRLGMSGEKEITGLADIVKSFKVQIKSFYDYLATSQAQGFPGGYQQVTGFTLSEFYDLFKDGVMNNNINVDLAGIAAYRSALDNGETRPYEVTKTIDDKQVSVINEDIQEVISARTKAQEYASSAPNTNVLARWLKEILSSRNGNVISQTNFMEALLGLVGDSYKPAFKYFFNYNNLDVPNTNPRFLNTEASGTFVGYCSSLATPYGNQLDDDERTDDDGNPIYDANRWGSNVFYFLPMDGLTTRTELKEALKAKNDIYAELPSFQNPRIADHVTHIAIKTQWLDNSLEILGLGAAPVDRENNTECLVQGITTSYGTIGDELAKDATVLSIQDKPWFGLDSSGAWARINEKSQTVYVPFRSILSTIKRPYETKEDDPDVLTPLFETSGYINFDAQFVAAEIDSAVVGDTGIGADSGAKASMISLPYVDPADYFELEPKQSVTLPMNRNGTFIVDGRTLCWGELISESEINEAISKGKEEGKAVLDKLFLAVSMSSTEDTNTENEATRSVKNFMKAFSSQDSRDDQGPALLAALFQIQQHAAGAPNSDGEAGAESTLTPEMKALISCINTCVTHIATQDADESAYLDRNYMVDDFLRKVLLFICIPLIGTHAAKSATITMPATIPIPKDTSGEPKDASGELGQVAACYWKTLIANQVALEIQSEIFSVVATPDDFGFDADGNVKYSYLRLIRKELAAAAEAARKAKEAAAAEAAEKITSEITSDDKGLPWETLVKLREYAVGSTPQSRPSGEIANVNHDEYKDYTWIGNVSWEETMRFNFHFKSAYDFMNNYSSSLRVVRISYDEMEDGADGRKVSIGNLLGYARWNVVVPLLGVAMTSEKSIRDFACYVLLVALLRKWIGVLGADDGADEGADGGADEGADGGDERIAERIAELEALRDAARVKVAAAQNDTELEEAQAELESAESGLVALAQLKVAKIKMKPERLKSYYSQQLEKLRQSMRDKGAIPESAWPSIEDDGKALALAQLKAAQGDSEYAKAFVYDLIANSSEELKLSTLDQEGCEFDAFKAYMKSVRQGYFELPKGTVASLPDIIECFPKGAAILSSAFQQLNTNLPPRKLKEAIQATATEVINANGTDIDDKRNVVNAYFDTVFQLLETLRRCA